MPILTTSVQGNRATLEVEAVKCEGLPQGTTWTALIDTGATGSALRGDVFRAGSIDPGRARVTVTNADGDEEKRKYFACDLHISDAQGNTVILTGQPVIGLDENADEEAIIGMDILLKCDLELDGPKAIMKLDFP